MNEKLKIPITNSHLLVQCKTPHENESKIIFKINEFDFDKIKWMFHLKYLIIRKIYGKEEIGLFTGINLVVH